MVAVGGFWFIPATHIAIFLGIFAWRLRHRFGPHLPGNHRQSLHHGAGAGYAAARINLAQSCNGIGWIFGPITGGMYFYSKDAQGAARAARQL